MQRNGPLTRRPTARREREPPTWPVLALCAAVPVALVVVLSVPVLIAAVGLGLVGAAAVRRRRPKWRPFQRASWLFVRISRFRSRSGVRRQT